MRLLPEADWADRLIAFKKFVRRHKRLPSNRPIFNDVLYQLKTGDQLLDPLRVFVTDKEFVKLFVKAVIGDQYNMPTIDVLRHAGEVDSKSFPDECCIKPTHASGLVMFRRDAAALDTGLLKRWFKLNFYANGRERNYRYLQPKLIVEPIIAPNGGLLDYKIFCFNGVARLIMVDTDRSGDHRRNFFDADWRDLGFSTMYPMADVSPARPSNLLEMIDVATALSARFNGLVRIDLYDADGVVLVGEITNVSGNAQANFIPPSAEKVASDILFDDA